MAFCIDSLVLLKVVFIEGDGYIFFGFFILREVGENYFFFYKFENFLMFKVKLVFRD